MIRKEAHETKNGSKLFIPYSFDEDKQDWIKKAWDKDRCLFDEHKLKEQLELPVLISEGEKAAVYGKNNLKSYVHVTWQGGSNAVHKTNFQHLKDREVILFPDNDEEGIKAMVHVAKILIEDAITTNIKIVDTEHLPKKFDIADIPLHHELNIPNVISKAAEFNPDKYEDEIAAIQKAEDKRNYRGGSREIFKSIYLCEISSIFL